MSVSAIQFSIGRSGSTLIWQVLNHLFENVPKVHEKEVEDISRKSNYAPLVITQRHPLDNLLSIIKVRHYATNIAAMESGVPRGVLSSYMGEYKRKERDLRELCKNYPGKVLVLKYEKFYNNYDYIFKEMERFFNLTIPVEMREKIMKDTSISANKNRQGKLKDFFQTDLSSHIHGDHITYPEPGKYAQLLDSTSRDFINNQLQQEIAYWHEYWREEEDHHGV